MSNLIFSSILKITTNIKFFLAVLFLSICSFTALAQAPTPFADACADGTLYQVISGKLTQFDMNNGNLVPTTICNSYTDANGNNVNLANYNSLAFNETDNFIYAWSGSNSSFVRIGENCVVEILGTPTNNTGCGHSGTYAGGFAENGKYYVFHNGNDKLIEVDVTTNTVTDCITMTLNGGNVPGLADIAWDAEDDFFVGINGSNLYELDPVTGEVTEVALTGLQGNDSGNNKSVGSIFGIKDGTIIAFYNGSGRYYQVYPTIGTAVLALTESPNGQNDGASCSQTNIFCPLAIEMAVETACSDSLGTSAGVGEYYVKVNINTNGSSSAPYTIISDENGNKVTQTTTWNGTGGYYMGPFSHTDVIVMIQETGGLCVDVAKIVVPNGICDSEPALSMTKTSDAGANISPGQIINYTIQVTNDANASGTAYYVKVDDIIPSGATYVANSAQKTYNIDQSSGEQTGTFTKDLGTLDFETSAGTAQTYEVTSSDVPAGATLTSYSFTVNGSSQHRRKDVSLVASYPSGSIEVDRGFDADNNEFGGGAGTWNAVTKTVSNASGTALGNYTFTWYDKVNKANVTPDNTVSSAEFTIHYKYESTSRVSTTNAAHAPVGMVLSSDNVHLHPGESLVLTYQLKVNNDHSGDLINTASVSAANATSSISANDRVLVLPVELISFNVEEINCEALLTWETASQENFSHFEIQSSKDGKSFHPIGRVDGLANTLEHSTFSHKTALEGELQYYRLKMIDLDETYEYSPITVLRTNCEEEKEQLTIFPNPFNKTGDLTVRMFTHNSETNIMVVDVAGKIVLTQPISNLYDGWNDVTLDVSHLAKGMYFIADDAGNTTRLIIAED